MKNIIIGTALAVAAQAACAASAPVAQDQFGAEWPFTVAAGTLECVAPVDALLFHAQGRTYALNGTAQGWARHNGVPLTELETIWKMDPAIQGLRVNVGPVMAKARTLCR